MHSLRADRAVCAGAIVTRPQSLAVWVISDVAPDGSYALAVNIGEDRSRILDHAGAHAYASTVLAACARAEYDAAVLAQMQADLGLSLIDAGYMVRDLRAGRPPLDDDAIAPLRLEPVVGRAGPVLHVYLDGQRVSQWTLAEAHTHALHVLQVLAGVPLDAGYRQLLVDHVGVTPDIASRLVHVLINHRNES